MHEPHAQDRVHAICDLVHAWSAREAGRPVERPPIFVSFVFFVVPRGRRPDVRYRAGAGAGASVRKRVRSASFAMQLVTRGSLIEGTL